MHNRFLLWAIWLGFSAHSWAAGIPTGTTINTTGGKSISKFGNNMYIGTDGTTYRRFGNALKDSNGYSWQIFGNSIKRSDGKRCEFFGNRIKCQSAKEKTGLTPLKPMSSSSLIPGKPTQ